MMEILFKAKSLKTKDWVYGYYVESESNNGDFVEYFIIERKSNGCSHNIDAKTLCQYTDLVDKNNNRIFEGDVVKHKIYGKCRVMFLQQECGYVYVTNDSDYRMGHRKSGCGYEVDENAEVVGNIYDKY